MKALSTSIVKYRIDIVPLTPLTRAQCEATARSQTEARQRLGPGLPVGEVLGPGGVPVSVVHYRQVFVHRQHSPQRSPGQQLLRASLNSEFRVTSIINRDVALVGHILVLFSRKCSFYPTLPTSTKIIFSCKSHTQLRNLQPATCVPLPFHI